MSTAANNAGIDAGGIDRVTLSLYLILVILGWLMIYSAEYNPDTTLPFLDLYHGKQTLYIGISLVFATVILLFDSRFFKTFAYAIYGLTIIGLIITLFVAREINGSRSWIQIGGFGLQMAEFAKMGTALAIASYLGGYEVSLKHDRTRAIALGIILIPIALVLMQGDLGSTLVFSSFFLMLYREGFPAWIYILGIVVAVLSIFALVFPLESVLMFLVMVAGGLLIDQVKTNKNRILIAWILLSIGAFALWWYGYLIAAVVLLGLGFVSILALLFINKKNSFITIVIIGLIVGSIYTSAVNLIFYNVLKRHQQERILVWLKPSTQDPRGTLYNVNQSKRAIGSGGLVGKGFLNGTVTKLGHVPEEHTDFIFCTVGEEQGFIGSTGLVILYLMLMLRVVYIGERQRSKFTRIYAYSVAGIFFFHFTVNVGMTMGLVPIIGIPLPFLSYGGSSMIAFTILLFILIKLDSARNINFR